MVNREPLSTTSKLLFDLFLIFKAVAQAQRHGGAVETTQKCKFMPPGSLYGCNGSDTT